MGYRTYLGKMNKQVIEELRHMTKEEFVRRYEELDELPMLQDLPTLENMFELGSYVDEELKSAVIDKASKKFFKDAFLHAKYDEDTEIYVIGKSGLIQLIEEYRKKTIHSFENLLGEPNHYERVEHGENARERKMRLFLESRLRRWNNPHIDYLNVDENSSTLHELWDFEYEVFNLLHLLKMMDWEKDDLILYCH